MLRRGTWGCQLMLVGVSSFEEQGGPTIRTHSQNQESEQDTGFNVQPTKYVWMESISYRKYGGVYEGLRGVL